MIYALFRATIAHPEKLAAYREQAAAALARHGGKVEHATASVMALDGAPDVPDVAALLSFPDAGAAHAWIDDPELQALHDLRRAAGRSDILLLG